MILVFQNVSEHILPETKQLNLDTSKTLSLKYYKCYLRMINVWETIISTMKL